MAASSRMVPPAPLRAVELIERKRDGGELDERELRFLVDGYLDGSVGEGQTAALLMAGVVRGFTEGEAVALTQVLLDSGERLDLRDLAGPTIDKHSTGGVADGTTLLVAPLLAACGAQVVKLSGRGLGHTGGTLDKIESIPGLRTDLGVERMLAVAGEVGCVVAAHSDRLVPADRALYALRDMTGTVASTALIASSVMSKKLAAGAGTIVLDVKAGSGAFMRTAEEAVVLAELCVRIATGAGRRCVALVTAMDEPLGRGVGNALEVAEAVRLLRAPPREGDRLAGVALDLAAHALGLASGESPDADGGRLTAQLIGLWEDGQALERLRAMVTAQGGDPAVCDDPASVLPVAPVIVEVGAPHTGVVTAVPARAVGEVALALGAGRAAKGDAVDPAVGLELRVERGQRVDAGEPIAVVHARNREAAERAAAQVVDLVLLGEQALPQPPTLLQVVNG